MSYAIIRNAKYKRENLMAVYRHNERKNKNYSNENIDRTKSHLNYSLKESEFNYVKEFDEIIKKYDLKGQIKKVSNIVCEYMITSDNDFFKRIGEEETKRYFETAYKFVCEYKNLGEKYILSAKIHNDERSPHMHLVFLPVVHTTDKKGNPIEKLACSEFWKAKDSYRQLQNAFFEYMVANGFNLQRGLPKEETNRKHYSVEEYKKITNYRQTKEKLANMKLELPDVPEIKDINVARWSKKRDEKILEDIIKPKDNLINELYQDNLLMHQQLLRQEKMVEKAGKYEKERNKIMEDNKNLHNEVEQIKKDYKQKEFENEWNYKSKIRKLEKENNHLKKVVNKFKDTVQKFIKWIVKKFDITDENKLVRDFERENHTLIDVEKQVKKDDREKYFDLER